MNDKVTAKYREYHNWLTSPAAGFNGANQGIDPFNALVPAALLTIIDLVLESV